MWADEYQKLTSFDKDEFRRLANYLLSHTYLVRYTFNSSQQMTLPNSDYQTASRMFTLLRDYLAISGWQLEKDDNYGIMSLKNIYDHNRLRIDRFTTLFLYTCRLMYEEGREGANSFHTIQTDTSAIVEKMRTLGLLEKERKGKTTQKERLDAERALAHYNIVQKKDSSAWHPDGNQILILPSILAIIPNSGINDMKAEIEEMAADDELSPEQPEEPSAPGDGGES